MAEKAVTIGEGVQDSTIILGNGNTVVQIVNSIYNREELSKLVRESFKELTNLLDFWGKTFPAVDPKLELAKGRKQEPPGYEEYIEHFKQNNETARLLGEIKNRNPQEYRRFIAGQALEAVGLSADQIPEVAADTELVKRELQDLQQGDIAEYRDNINDPLEYEDRDEQLRQVRHDRKNSHIVLHGPSGVGKSYFVQKFQEMYKRDTCCVVIDLNSYGPGDIISAVVKQLSEEEGVRGTFKELAHAIAKIIRINSRINRFYFIFENADHNQGAVDMLLGPRNIIQHPDLIRYLKNWKLFDKIQLKIMIIARHIVEPKKGYPGYSHIADIKLRPLDQNSIQNLFDRIINKREDLPHGIGIDLVPELSDEIFYLTGGHPKCAKQMMIALADLGCIRPTEEEWVQLYRQHVVATIYEEMLTPMDLELLSVIWPLSIFRCFDQRLLGGLFERGILPGTPGNISRQAHDLRLELEDMSLFDVDNETSMVYTNYAVRNALSFHMQVKAPDRYRMLNAQALEIFLDRLQRSESGTDMKVERMAVNLLEILYHWTRLLGTESWKKKPQPGSKRVKKDVQKLIPAAFERYLQLALTLVQKVNRHDFLRALLKRWMDDNELQEAVRRASKRDDTVLEITDIINGIIKQHDTSRDGNE